MRALTEGKVVWIGLSFGVGWAIIAACALEMVTWKLLGRW